MPKKQSGIGGEGVLVKISGECNECGKQTRYRRKMAKAPEPGKLPPIICKDCMDLHRAEEDEYLEL